jgi:hypothetical protein
MSLEQAVKENTIALAALTQAWNTLAAKADAMSPAELASVVPGGTPKATVTSEVLANAKSEPEVKKNKVVRGVEVLPPVVTKVETVTKAEAKPKAEPVDASAVTYADISPLIVNIAKTISREAAIELLGKFGAAKGADIKPEQYAEFKAAAEAILNPETEDSLV